MFECKHFSRTRKACLNFVKNQHNVVLFSDLANFLQPFRRRSHHAAFTLNGFQDDSSWLCYTTFYIFDEVFEEVSQSINTRFTAETQWAAVFVRVGHELHAWH